MKLVTWPRVVVKFSIHILFRNSVNRAHARLVVKRDGQMMMMLMLCMVWVMKDPIVLRISTLKPVFHLTNLFAR